jgi:hypothetical protein
VSSPETAKRLEINWQLKRLPTVKNDGYGATTLPLQQLFDQSDLPKEARIVRPAMVWFLSSEPDPKLEKKLFDAYETAIGARYFECVKIFVEDIDSKADRDRYAKTVPSVIFLDASGKESGRLAGSFSPADVLRQMGKAANVYMKKPLASHVEKYAQFLKRFDKVEGKVVEAEEDIKFNEEHMVKHPCDRARNAIKEAQAELEELTVQKTKLEAEEKALLEPELKADPYAKPAETAAR